MIRPCSCQHAYQDAKYGKGNRVHNECKKSGEGTPPARCTVCGTLKK